MDWNASHAGFVAAAYALSAVVLAALVALTLYRDKRSQRDAALLERRGRAP